jgi:hypothetical protein
VAILGARLKLQSRFIKIGLGESGKGGDGI